MTQEFAPGGIISSPTMLTQQPYIHPALSVRISFDPAEIVIDLAAVPEDPDYVSQLAHLLADLVPVGDGQETGPVNLHFKMNNER